jgi:hypothetical protein
MEPGMLTGAMKVAHCGQCPWGGCTTGHCARLVSRKAAKSAAVPLKRYFTGIACKHGHVCERMVSDRSCLMCHAIKTRTRAAKDREAYRAIIRTDWSAHRDERNAAQRTHRSLQRVENDNE